MLFRSPVYEKDFAAVSSFFKEACLGGNWSPEQGVDAELSKNHGRYYTHFINVEGPALNELPVSRKKIFQLVRTLWRRLQPEITTFWI